jgi:hypothetical protein
LPPSCFGSCAANSGSAAAAARSGSGGAPQQRQQRGVLLGVEQALGGAQQVVLQQGGQRRLPPQVGERGVVAAHRGEVGGGGRLGRGVESFERQQPAVAAEPARVVDRAGALAVHPAVGPRDRLAARDHGRHLGRRLPLQPEGAEQAVGQCVRRRVVRRERERVARQAAVLAVGPVAAVVLRGQQRSEKGEREQRVRARRTAGRAARHRISLTSWPRRGASPCQPTPDAHARTAWSHDGFAAGSLMDASRTRTSWSHDGFDPG